MHWFTDTALRYKLHGKPLDELCLHNAEVADSLNRKHVSLNIDIKIYGSRYGIIQTSLFKMLLFQLTSILCICVTSYFYYQQIAQSWRILRLLFSNADMNTPPLNRGTKSAFSKPEASTKQDGDGLSMICVQLNFCSNLQINTTLTTEKAITLTNCHI